MAVVHVNASTFEQEVLQSDKPVLVDFWATWCGPCQMLGPVVEKMAEEMEQYKFCKVDVDQAPDLAQQYKVISIPTLMVFKGGQLVDTQIGVQPKSAIVAMLEK